MRASDFLKAGVDHMNQRADTYDAPEGERSMERTVKMFAELTGVHMSIEQGWKFMICLKLVRSEQGPFKSDSYEDGAAYFGLAGEVAAQYRREDPVPYKPDPLARQEETLKAMKKVEELLARRTENL